MTEEEAKTKACHKSFEVSGLRIGSGGSRTTIPSNFTMRCIGSACMAWRWEDGSYFDPKRGLQVHDMGTHGVGVARGHCGLAGKP